MPMQPKAGWTRPTAEPGDVQALRNESVKQYLTHPSRRGFALVTWNHYDTAVVTAARHWFMNPATDEDGYQAADGLWAFGPTGTGKTGMGHLLVVAAIRKGGNPLHITAEDLAEASRGLKDKAVMHKAKTACLLVLDDIGVGAATTHAVEAITNVLTHRLAAGLRTVYTSNTLPLSADQVDALDITQARLWSRLLETLTTLEVNGADARLSRIRSTS